LKDIFRDEDLNEKFTLFVYSLIAFVDSKYFQYKLLTLFLTWLMNFYNVEFYPFFHIHVIWEF